MQGLLWVYFLWRFVPHSRHIEAPKYDVLLNILISEMLITCLPDEPCITPKESLID